MSKKSETSRPPSESLEDSWERQLLALDAKLRASGRTVTVTAKEPSDSTEFVARFPVVRHSAALGAAPSNHDRMRRLDTGPVSLGVHWGDEFHVVSVRPRTWRRLALGARLSLRTSECYEGRRMRFDWGFDGLDRLEVTYAGGGTAYVGGLASAEVCEYGSTEWRRLREVGAGRP